MSLSIVITGSTKGIGLGLAQYFLNNGCQVMINGSSHHSTEQALSSLKPIFGNRVAATKADVTNSLELQRLLEEAIIAFGKVDIWINNAGVTQPSTSLIDTDSTVIDHVLNVNLKGMIQGSRTAVAYFLTRGEGALYNMEGLGSDGRIAKNLGYYGTSKQALRYFTRVLAQEMKDKNILIGRLSPGMVTTDLLLGDLRKRPDADRVLRIFSILADRVEVVTPFLGERILKNQKNDVLIAWLTTPKIIFRFLTAPFVKRNPFQ